METIKFLCPFCNKVPKLEIEDHVVTCPQREGKEIFKCKYSFKHVFNSSYDLIVHENTQCTSKED